MKRFLNYFASMAFIASLFVVASCSTEDEPGVDGPSILIDGTETTVNVGEEVTFDVNVTAPAGFNRLIVERTIGDGTTETIDDIARPAGTTATTYDYTFNYTPTAVEAGETVVIDFTVVDDANNENTSTYTIYVNEQEVVPYTAVLLAAPTVDQNNRSWFSTSLGEPYSTAEVNTQNNSGEIDFGYRYGPNAGATIASPAAYPSEGNQDLSDWEELNSTMLRRVSTGVSATQFAEMGTTAEEIMDAYEGGTADENSPERLTQLAEGQVLAFMTDPDKDGGSRYGLIHIEDIDMGTDGTGYGSDASVTINVKVIN